MLCRKRWRYAGHALHLAWRWVTSHRPSNMSSRYDRRRPLQFGGAPRGWHALSPRTPPARWQLQSLSESPSLDCEIWVFCSGVFFLFLAPPSGCDGRKKWRLGRIDIQTYVESLGSPLCDVFAHMCMARNTETFATRLTIHPVD